MNVAIVITRIGTPVATTRPRPVSPITRDASAETAVAIRPATTKITSAAITFGMYAQTAPTNAVRALMCSTEAASEIALRKITQNAIVPSSLDGCVVTLRTTLPPGPECTARSRPARCVAA